MPDRQQTFEFTTSSKHIVSTNYKHNEKMKKFYTLLAGLLVAGSASAIVTNPVPVKNVDMKSVMSKIEAIEYQGFKSETSSVPQGMMRAQDAQGNQWNVMVALRQPMADIMEIDFSEYPYYLMNMNFQCMAENNDNSIPLYIMWPSKVALKATESKELEKELYKKAEHGLQIDETAALKYFKTIEEAYEPCTFDEMVAAFKENDGVIRLNMVPGTYYMPSICSSAMFGASMKWNGAEYLSMSADVVGDQLDYTNATYIDWRGLDDTTSDIDVDVQSPYCKFTEQPNGALVPDGGRVGIAATQVSGNALLFGFADIIFDQFEEVHIFNVGRVQYGVSPESWYYPTAFDPLNQYFICWCHRTMAYMVKDQQGNEEQNFTNSSLPMPPTGMNLGVGAPGWAVDPNYEFTYMKAALWAPENSENPYGLWSMPVAEYKENQATGTITYMSAPAAKELIQPLNCDAGDHDGFKGLYQTYYMYPQPEKSWIGIGDKNYGFNFKFSTPMTGQYSIRGNFKGNIIYHPTPNKWVDEMVALPAVGNIEADAINQGGSESVEGVISNSPVVSSTYYNLQGQRISSAPENGIYIVRNVKADGTVEAVKVVK